MRQSQVLGPEGKLFCTSGASFANAVYSCLAPGVSANARHESPGKMDWQLLQASTYCDCVRLFLRITGLTLLTAAWLSVSLFGNSIVRKSSRNEWASGHASIDAAFTSQSPMASEQLRQFRPFGSQSCHSKGCGPDFFESNRDSKGIVLGSVKRLSLSTAPSELHQTWQFTRRTALQPRAPCPA